MSVNQVRSAEKIFLETDLFFPIGKTGRAVEEIWMIPGWADSARSSARCRYLLITTLSALCFPASAKVS